jgi:hypothetical protein
VAEVLCEFSEIIAFGGMRYHAHACGAPQPDGSWQGWVEFLPIDGGRPVRSPRETTQPNRADTAYWATGLSTVYLEGALERARRPEVRRTAAADAPAFDGPADGVGVRREAPEAHAASAAGDAVLDPFGVYEHEGEGLLRRRLAALAAWHLANIVRQYELSDEDPETLNRMSAPLLIERIMAAVRSSEIRDSRNPSR